MSLIMKTALLLLLLLAFPSRGETCVGDLNGDGRVTVDELIRCINQMPLLTWLPGLDECRAFDANMDGTIKVNELIAGVNNVLNGCPPRPAATPTPTRTATPTRTPIEEPVLRILTEIIVDECWNTGPIFHVSVSGSDGSYQFNCRPGPGHETQGSIQRYSTPGEAQAALEQRAPADATPFDFHNLVAVCWERDIDLLPGNHRPEYHGILWVVGCWLIDVHAFDDTRYWLVPPVSVSEAIFARAIQTGVIGGCLDAPQ